MTLSVLAAVPWTLSAISFAGALAISLALIALGAFEFRRVGWLQGRREVTRVVWRADGVWRLRTGDSEWPAELRRGWVVHSGLAVLDLRGDFGTRWVLMSGRLSDHRRMAVRLRLAGISSPSSVADLG